MNAELLAEHLRARGLIILDVTRHHTQPDVCVIYLHGNAGQHQHSFALDTVRTVPGVRRVVESVKSTAILLAWIETDGKEEPPAQAHTVSGHLGVYGSRPYLT